LIAIHKFAAFIGFETRNTFFLTASRVPIQTLVLAIW